MALDFARVRTTFEAALELAPERRAAFLHERCGDDEGLRLEVEQLLARDASATPMAHWLDGGAAGNATALPQLEGAAIDDFTLRSVLGSGGMGTVYLAEQQEPRRDVALKVLSPGFGSKAAVARFRFEAEVLARLQHPGIAQIHAAGVHRAGALELPWFALELVADARDLLAWANERDLSIAARLDHLLLVCDAVHHGHLHGVVHRDLKPANVLVGADGRPKVIDFGVARSLAGDDAAARATEHGFIVGTLAYMSPEQLAGDDVDHRADVWALGVLAFEMLTGERPFELQGATLPQAMAILQGPPPRVSARAKVALPHDLDAVLGKALRVDRAERYESVIAFAGDLRAVLQQRPVSAQPPSTWYHLRLFVRRRRATAFALAAVLLTVVAATVALALQNRELRRQQQQSTRIAAFTRRVLGEADIHRDRGVDYTVREALDEARRELADETFPEPLVEAELHALLGDAYRGLGLPDVAAQEFEAAVQLFTAANGSEDRKALAARISLLACRFEAGDVQGQDAALDLDRGWATLVARVAAALGEDAVETLRARHEQALRLRLAGRLLEAEVVYRSVLAARERVLGDKAPATIATLHNLGALLLADDRIEAARDVLSDCLQRSRAAGEARASTWQIADSLGEVQRELGDLDGAAATHREAIAKFTALLGPDHELTIGCGYHLLKVLHRQGEMVRMGELATDLLARCERAFGADDRRTMDVLTAVGVARLRTQDNAGALAALDRAFTTYERVLGNNHATTLQAGQTLGAAQLATGDARACLATAVDLVGRLADASELRPTIAGSLHVLHARALAATGDFAGSFAAAQAARAVMLPQVPAAHPLVQQADELMSAATERRGGG